MHKNADKFAKFCKSKFNLEKPVPYTFRSLPICIIDAVYSLNDRYTHTEKIHQNYANACLGGDRESPVDSISRFLQFVDSCGGEELFAKNVLCSSNKIAGKIPKEQITCKIAKYLKILRIETIEDFKSFESEELLEAVLYSVKGFKDAGVNYLFMLAGDPNRCKPDTHIKKAVLEGCGEEFKDNNDCQTLFRDTVEKLKEDYPALTVRQLDGVIWSYYNALGRTHQA